MNRIARFWSIGTSKLTVGEIPTSTNIKVYSNYDELLASGYLPSLLEAYVNVFLESWGETHDKTDVNNRLQRQLKKDAVLILILNQERVVGFSWAGLLTTEEVVEDCSIEPTFSHVQSQEWPELLENLTRNLGTRRILFVYEMGILNEFRGNLSNLANMFGNILNLGWIQHIRQVIWWTSHDSTASGLALAMGFELAKEVGGLPFYFLEDFEPLLKAITRLQADQIRRFLGAKVE